jgi:hypothetical protein
MPPLMHGSPRRTQHCKWDASKVKIRYESRLFLSPVPLP